MVGNMARFDGQELMASSPTT